ncbi:hypothetical protein KP509_19G034600 [Ceratopteris richardii]|uniref:Uncharacterized protein n=1 Tax=Ceratopteris richardii TaxID=49495 RepID=A0A8T2SL94_CERRI|nr:hypothetical protein KP509_19G034600 [Ceratopteris richardii]
MGSSILSQAPRLLLSRLEDGSNATGLAVEAGHPRSIFSSSSHSEMPSLVHAQRLVNASYSENSETENTELVDLLVACVDAISAGSVSAVNHLLARLGRLASPEGESPMHRLAAYFAEGLAWRASRMWPHIYQPMQQKGGLALGGEGWDDAASAADSASFWQALNEATPLVKFSHFTANEVILGAFEGEEAVHVIDLDIKQGLQWPALFHGLATRNGGPPRHIRVTGVGRAREEVQEVGDRLMEFAEEIGLRLEFHGVVDRLEDVRLWMLHVKGNESAGREAVAINCILQLHHSLGDSSGASLRNLLELLRSARPKVVVMVEQEADCHDQPSLAARFPPALRYFAALFDALDDSLPPSSPSRRQIESHFADHIRNIVACDGGQRVERYQPLRRWERLLSTAGFSCLPLTERCRLQAQLLLRAFSSNYRILPELSPKLSQSPSCLPPGHLTLAWIDHPLLTLSAWTPSTG